MEYFDNVLQKNIKVHEEVTPEIGKNLVLKQPDDVEEYYRKKAEKKEEE